MGNICRSPTAEGIFRHIAARDAAAEWEIDSAGTHDYHIGASPDTRAIAAARQRGINLTGLRARKIELEDFERFDLILAMDRENLSTLQQCAISRLSESNVMDFAPDAYGKCHPRIRRPTDSKKSLLLSKPALDCSPSCSKARATRKIQSPISNFCVLELTR